MEQEYKDLLIGIANHLISLQEITDLNGRRQAYIKNNQLEQAIEIKAKQAKILEKLPNIKELLEKCK